MKLDMSVYTVYIYFFAAGLQVETERKSIMVAVGNSTYLECLPKSHHASVTWLKETGENSAELHQVYKYYIKNRLSYNILLL